MSKKGITLEGPAGTGKTLHSRGLDNNPEIVEAPLAKVPADIKLYKLVAGPTESDLWSEAGSYTFTAEDGTALQIETKSIHAPYQVTMSLWHLVGLVTIEATEFWATIEFDPKTGEGLAVLSETYHRAVTYNPYAGDKPVFMGAGVLIMAWLRNAGVPFLGDKAIFIDEAEERLLK